MADLFGLFQGIRTGPKFYIFYSLAPKTIIFDIFMIFFHFNPVGCNIFYLACIFMFYNCGSVIFTLHSCISRHIGHTLCIIAHFAF